MCYGKRNNQEPRFLYSFNDVITGFQRDNDDGSTTLQMGRPNQWGIPLVIGGGNGGLLY